MNAYVARPATPGPGIAPPTAHGARNRTGRDRAALPARLGFPDMIDVDPGARTLSRRTP
jgi:hypothetical protein